MANNEEMIEVLNDLIEINNDRIEGYRKAIDESEPNNGELLSIYNMMIDESDGYKSELQDMIQKYGGEIETDETSNSGKLYRFWMDFKTTFTSNSDKSILELCEFGEDAAQKAYQRALESESTMIPEVRTLIKNQKSSLKISHDKIRQYRDSHRKYSRY